MFFADDDVGLSSHVSSELLLNNNAIVKQIIEFQHKLTGQHCIDKLFFKYKKISCLFLYEHKLNKKRPKHKQG